MKTTGHDTPPEANSSGPAAACGQCHVRQLEALYEISKLIATRSSQQEMFQNILKVLEKRLGFNHGTIMLTSPDNKELVVEVLGDSMRSDVVYRMGEGITGAVLRYGQPLIVPKMSDEPRFKSRIHRRGSAVLEQNSFICVPVILENETVGTISVDVPRQTIDLDEAQKVLSIVAGIIAHDTRQRRLARLEKQALEEENLRLRNQLQDRYQPDNIIGSSAEMRDIFNRIHLVAEQSTTVLIRGESGTGKELVASAIHYSSRRASGPFVKVNCAALSENLLESELFGHEKGAFTGAIRSRRGRIEEAEGGTLFLDEIGDFSPTIQLKLLRVLQEREFERVGSNETLKADVRIIAATNRNLEEMVAEGAFRQDFYYRINVFAVHLPPLRDRKNDILLLANHFIKKLSESMGKQVRRISTPAIQMLLAYHWPGNVRELENCIEHAILMCHDGVVHGRDLPPTLQVPGSSDMGVGTLKARIQVMEKDMIVDALKRTRGNVSAAARELGITGRMVRYKIQNLGIPYDRLFKSRRQPRGE